MSNSCALGKAARARLGNRVQHMRLDHWSPLDVRRKACRADPA